MTFLRQSLQLFPPLKFNSQNGATATFFFGEIVSFFPNSFSYGVFANIGSGAVPGRLPGGRFREVPGRFRGRFRTTGSGKVPGQVVPGRVPGQCSGTTSGVVS